MACRTMMTTFSICDRCTRSLPTNLHSNWKQSCSDAGSARRQLRRSILECRATEKQNGDEPTNCAGKSDHAYLAVSRCERLRRRAGRNAGGKSQTYGTR